MWSPGWSPATGKAHLEKSEGNLKKAQALVHEKVSVQARYLEYAHSTDGRC